MSALSKWTKKIERNISSAIPHQHSADRRAANAAVAEQIDFYQKQKQEMVNEASRLEGERTTEKNKIATKQIKSARRAYRQPGFMDQVDTGYSNTLG